MTLTPPISTLFPYTTLFRSIGFKGGKRKPSRVLFTTEDLSFQPGDFVAVIGPNGSGKTTLFNSILSEQKIISGEIYHKNVNWNSITREDKVKVIDRKSVV